jgi:hypothetical protein
VLLAVNGTFSGAQEGDRARVALSATPERLEVVGLPCLPSTLTAGMANEGSEAIYADAFLDTDAPVSLEREVISSYLPPGYRQTFPIDVTVPRDAQPGDYSVRLRSGRATLTVPLTVLPLPSKAPGENLAYGEQATASSTHGNFTLCGGVDGNRNSEDWDVRTGWNDATRATFPDTYGVKLPEPARVGRVELYSLDSTRFPAARNSLRDWDVQALVAGEWRTVAEVRGNTAGHVTSTFESVDAEAVQIVALASNDGAYSRIVELEVYSE